MILSKLVTAIAALTATATAGVVRRDAQVVTTAQLQALNLYEQYSAATYCTRNELVQPGTAIACAAGNCPDVEQHAATVLFPFLNEGDGGVTGFIAVDNTPGSIALILAFRGVRSIETGITEIDTRLVPAAGCGVGCEVHEGFQESWDSVSARITRELTNAQVATGITTLVVTGHGVGGALATLAATQFRTTIIPGITAGNVRLFTYGSPRVGNRIFATFVTTGNGATNFRVTHTDDPIPKFPSRSLGYLQWGPEYWIRSPTGQPVHTNDIDIIPGVETTNGNAGTPPSLDIPAHLWYFNSVTACI